MPLTPRTIRKDLKCGRGAISKGEKCTKGAASTASTTKNKRNKTALKVAALAVGAGLAGVALAPHTARIGVAAKRIVNKNMLAKRIRYLPANMVGRARISRIQNKPLPKANMKNGKVVNPWWDDSMYGYGDSLWAVGFSPDPRSDAFIGSNRYNKGKEAAFKARHHRPAKG